MEELISIIMPTYNAEKYIRDSISSVLCQTNQNWELLVIDDCSTDGTVDIVKSFVDERIKLLKNDVNSGAAVSRNYGLREAAGKYIAFLDSDDTWACDKLEKQIKFMKENGYSFTYTDYRIKNNGIWDKNIITAPNKVTRRKLYNYCYFSTITVMYNREEIGLIQIESIRKNNDYAMWFQAIKKGVVARRLPECLSFYIKHNNSVSSGSKVKLIKWHYILFRKCLKKKRVSSFFLTINNLFHGVIKKMKYKRKAKEIDNLQIRGK